MLIFVFDIGSSFLTGLNLFRSDIIPFLVLSQFLLNRFKPVPLRIISFLVFVLRLFEEKGEGDGGNKLDPFSAVAILMPP